MIFPLYFFLAPLLVSLIHHLMPLRKSNNWDSSFSTNSISVGDLYGLFWHETSKKTHANETKHRGLSLLVFVLFKNAKMFVHKQVYMCLHIHASYLCTNLCSSTYPHTLCMKPLTAWNLAGLHFFCCAFGLVLLILEIFYFSWY